MVLLQGILNTIVIFVARVAGSLIAGAISKSDDGPSPWLSGLISLVLEIALGFAAMIVLMAFSRHREYHADLGSAKYLGKDRMIAALKKLNTLHDDLAGKIETDGRIATMQISSYKISSLFSSHPPLADRIKALQDRYDVA